ncbi:MULTISPECIES: hypothetical protein [unclassified Micromonospora]|uniref:hypothetical protein n=1 Tax=unclassified Micromonospora TaxID=2617518 RepID=UPI003A85DD0F
MSEIQTSGVLVVGPRPLPEHSRVRVWMEAGSGGGHEVTVRTEHLTLSDRDSGQGSRAIYELRTIDRRG